MPKYSRIHVLQNFNMSHLKNYCIYILIINITLHCVSQRGRQREWMEMDRFFQWGNVINMVQDIEKLWYIIYIERVLQEFQKSSTFSRRYYVFFSVFKNTCHQKYKHQFSSIYLIHFSCFGGYVKLQ